VKNGIFNSLYSGYVIGSYFLIMVPILLFALLTFFLPTSVRLLAFYRFARLLTRGWSLLTMVRIKTVDRHKLLPQQTYVLVSNHVNLLDILVAGTQIVHPFFALAKKEFLRIPVLGQIVGLIAIPVDRSSKESRLKSRNIMLSHLRQGHSILIFPEGTRNRSQEALRPFYDGAFATAIQAQLPILPMVILDSRPMQPPNTARVHPGTCKLMFLDPISTAGKEMKDLEEVKQEVRNAMETALLRHDAFFSPSPHPQP
jgi:1-acyl-sn-glycerol-3-phosphate acyltransferase